MITIYKLVYYRKPIIRGMEIDDRSLKKALIFGKWVFIPPILRLFPYKTDFRPIK